MNDEYFMREALLEAQKAYLMGEVPVGAVAVYNGKIIARAHNLKETANNPTSHAEIILIDKVSKILNTWYLTDVDIYVTLEPCLMCSGAALQARIRKLVFGARDTKFGAVRSLYNVLDDKRTNHSIEIVEGICAQESAELLRNFFRERR